MRKSKQPKSRSFYSCAVCCSIFFFSFVVLIIPVAAQTSILSEIKSAYIYQLSNHITWPNEDSIDEFRVAVIGQDSGLASALELDFSRVTHNGKRIVVHAINNLDQLPGYHLVYVTNNSGFSVHEVARAARGSNTLIISDGSDEKREFMINLIRTSNNTLSFEVNRSNIVFEGLQASKDILLLGGSEVDIAHIFRETESILLKMKQESLQLSRSLISQSEKLEDREQKLEIRTRQLAEKSSEFLQQQLRSLVMEKQANILAIDLEEAARLLKEKQIELRASQHELSRKQELAKEKEAEVVSLTGLIAAHSEILKAQELETVKQTEQVSELLGTVGQQRKFIQRALVVTIIFSVLLGFILRINQARKRSNVELGRARQEADQANRAKSDFLASMSHEIRTPMNGVIGMLEVLQESSLTGEQADLVDVIRGSAFSLLGVISNVLDFSKIEAGEMQIEQVPLGVVDMVEGVVASLDHTAAKMGVELTLFTDPAIPQQVLADEQHLRQTLINLVGNAIKFSSKQDHLGKVTVHVVLDVQDADRVTLEFQVIDNGIGMEEETLVELFRPFTQADNSTSRRFGGTGLGLTISYQLVMAMGGQITAQSTPGQGSKFVVKLPFEVLSTVLPEVDAVTKVTRRAAPKTETTPSRKPEAPTVPTRDEAQRQGRLILVAEDNEINQMVINRQLTLLGYVADIADDGKQALEKWQTGDYGLLLCDLHMPVMDGYELTAAIRMAEQGDEHLPIVALTADVLVGKSQYCLEVGMDDYLSKPAVLAVLKVILEKWLPKVGY